MLVVALSIIALGLLICAVGGIWSIVVAFQRHVLWGLAVLLLPFANLIFLFVAWAEAKRPFLIGLIGLIIAMLGVFAMPEESMKSFTRAQFDMNAVDAVAAAPAGPSREEVQQRLAALRTREADLLARKAAVDPKNATAVAQLDAEIRKYNEELQPLLEQLK